MNRNRTPLVPTLVLATVFLTVAATSVSHAQDQVARLNGMLKKYRPADRSDLVLFPVLADIKAPPAGVETRRRARLAPYGGSAWGAAEAWATAPEQKAVLDAIVEVTQEDDYRRAMGVGQPYGVSGIDMEFVRSGMYTELGDPPTIAAARHLYMPKLDDAACLVHVEATRRAGEGDPMSALDVLLHWAYFTRQMADRLFAEEARWGIDASADAMERIRDIVYMDTQNDRTLTPDQIAEVIERIDPDRGIMGLDRLPFPPAEKLAGRQLLDLIFEGRGQIRREAFASTLARVSSSERPLRLFSAAAKWDGVLDTHADGRVTGAMLDRIYGDWEARWPLPPNDSKLRQTFEYEDLDRGLYPVLRAVLSLPNDRGLGLGVIFEERSVFRAEVIGTRQALAVVGYRNAFGAFPPHVSSVRPRWIKKLAGDPFNQQTTARGGPPLEYFVPVRDTAGLFGQNPEDKNPHTINIINTDGPNLAKRLREDQFVLYSVGGDGARDWAQRVQNTGAPLPGADYLIWPPVLSLKRQAMIDRGELK